MAAGKGTRMKNPDMAKVMYEIHGRPMIDYVVDLAVRADAERTIAVVGWKKDDVIAHLAKAFPQVRCVEQTPQLGTGHAVMQAEKELTGFRGDVVVLSGDAPLLSMTTMQSLIDAHRSNGAVATVLTAIVPDPTGYGRVLRNGDGLVTGIVEQRDATEVERAVREINSGIYVFDAIELFRGLQQITPDNAQKEYYLTDVFKYFWTKKLRVGAVAAPRPIETQGINTIEQLEEVRGLMPR